MAEYIDRDMFLKLISHKPSCPTTDREDRLINGFISAVKNCPAADVREVGRGKWMLNALESVATCSECECCVPTIWKDPDIYWNFCPNCGADMRPRPPKEG